MTKKILTDLGYHVFDIVQASEALAFVDSYPGKIDLLITDVVMPEMNGRELSDQLQYAKPGLQCLYMSGYTEDAIAHHGVFDEGVHFIHKPFSRTEFSYRVSEALYT